MIGGLLALLLPSPAAAAQRAVRPNPYAPSLPAQASFAIGQSVRAGVLSPLNHVRQMPLEPFAAGSFVALVVLTALVTAAGLAAFRKRDVVST